MNARDILIKSIRKGYRKIAHPVYPTPVCDTDRQSSNDKIYRLLSSDKPCMISRFGTGEIGIVCNYLGVHGNGNLLNRCSQYIFDNHGLPWWDKVVYKSMHLNAGIFPTTINTLERFSERYLQDIPEIDLLGSFNATEVLMPLRDDVIYVHLECLYPFFVERPWTAALKGKKILVVHPFVESIKLQHSRHEKIFDNPDIFPQYKISFVKAVQSNAGATVPFKDWFEALKWMEDEISKIDFDIAIIGCGAYGLPLAAYIKRLGKKSIHLGGGSQLLFGIKGKRWDNNQYHWASLPKLDTNYSRLYNQYWIRPNQNETPNSANMVEGACYW